MSDRPAERGPSGTGHDTDDFVRFCCGDPDCPNDCERETPPGPASVSPADTPRRYYESIIKVNPTDDPARRASHIAEGIGYACALLMDEYNWTAERIADVLERVTDDVADQEAQRGR